MAERWTDSYLCIELKKLSDYELSNLLLEFIDEAMIENGMYYDNEDRQNATTTLYPIIASIIFHPNYRYMRSDNVEFFEFLECLVKKLG